MSGHLPTPTSNSQQFSNAWHNPNFVRSNGYRNYGEDLYPTYQVDSWRSYRNDTTNLQNTAGYSSNVTYPCAVPIQQPLHFTNQFELNPAATSFRPINYAMGSPTQFTSAVHHPLRSSGGMGETIRQQQIRTYSAAANSRTTQRYALRPRESTRPLNTLQDTPLQSIEHHTRYSSSIPINLNPYSEAQRRLTPRQLSPSVSPPPAPSPKPEYLSQASLPLSQLTAPQKLLVVVDLNGTLLKRGVSRGTSFVLRPGVTNFMEYLFANHSVMIYSSARPENVTGMVNKLLHPWQRNQLVAIWARDRLGLNIAQYKSKVQVYKNLEKIWADSNVQKRAGKGRQWDQTNTILVDDSHLKALAQPYNLLKVEEFLNDRPGGPNPVGNTCNQEHMEALNDWISTQHRIVADLQNKLEALKWTQDVSRLIRVWQSTETNKHGEQSVDSEQIQLLTPKSLETTVSDDDQSDGGVDATEDDSYETPEHIGDLHVQHHTNQREIDNLSDGSVSSIDEAMWGEILSGAEKTRDLPLTPKRVVE